ncbi:phosphatidylglycerol lysyltransferase domain-containing protein [Parapedobacter koreensis]|uniref:Phosphatidylglycerol lysyltransferase n=1 Tax=Parapedobacter koreensis TaxID=332977 RepID=A0A1H7QVG5_9SPHI|nr:phosphatidylglycerol lysyltransferase domain-containing protein [Parapedobacter koreensis]SEL51307.1 phosphatidylglycerol lysyltransferase [Parapedobacter koreensis]
MKHVVSHLKAQHYYVKEILGFFFIILGIYFLRQHGQEFTEVKTAIVQSSYSWLALGLLLVAAYIGFQALMYMASFKTVGKSLSFHLALSLFLKRNLISVFLPGGGFTSLIFFTKEIEKTGVSKTKINFASYIYGLVGIASLILVAIPVIVYLALTDHHIDGEWEAIMLLVLFVGLIAWLSVSLYRKQWAYRLLVRYMPSLEHLIEEIHSGAFALGWLYRTLAYSMAIEAIGILHLYIAMLALGLVPSLTAAVAGYVIATLFLCISPFMRGLGAVEISMVLVLRHYGFDDAQALSAAFLYRFFEFWLPLVIGVMSFIFQRGNVFLRIFPSVLLFLLGVVNIASVLTPVMAQRMRLLRQFIPGDAIHFSTYMVLLMGVLLIICSAFLLKGLRNAWYIAMGLSVLSFFGHMAKAIDYEEALLALFSIITLAFTYRQYYIKRHRDIRYFSIGTALLLLIAVAIYGTVGFYYLKTHHFLDDFTWGESLVNALACLVLLDTDYLQPQTEFARYFVYSLNLFGIFTLSLLFYAFIRPYIWKTRHGEAELERARMYISRYGNSACDHFKMARDKLFFFAEGIDGVIAYRVANNYAVVLHEPVCATDDERTKLMVAFNRFCKENSLRAFYYRIDEERLPFYDSIGWKAMPIGQEALVGIEEFRLEGKDRKSLRNALNSVAKKGYGVQIYHAPIKDGLLQKLRHVSDSWLESMQREELVFSQGMFDEAELKQQTIITLENADEKVVAFLNVIPDYAAGELTYDLIRKTADAPGGSMDALIVALIEYGRSIGQATLNMGLAPFSGIDRPADLPQRTVKFAYEKLQLFRHYKGLREFKDKFNPEWKSKYLLFDHHYDLLQAPLTLAKVVKPTQ